MDLIPRRRLEGSWGVEFPLCLELYVECLLVKMQLSAYLGPCELSVAVSCFNKSLISWKEGIYFTKQNLLIMVGKMSSGGWVMGTDRQQGPNDAWSGKRKNTKQGEGQVEEADLDGGEAHMWKPKSTVSLNLSCILQLVCALKVRNTQKCAPIMFMQ